MKTMGTISNGGSLLSWFVVDERKTWEFLDVVKVMMAYVVAIVVVVGNEREGKKKKCTRERGRQRERQGRALCDRGSGPCLVIFLIFIFPHTIFFTF
jgi:hypothetical protein